MRVTLQVLLEEQRQAAPSYDPSPGTEYEVGEGVVVRLVAPTMRRQAQYLAAIDEMEEAKAEGRKSVDVIRETLEKTVRLAKIATEGEWPGDVEDLFHNVAHRITEDFTHASSLISRPAMPLSPQQEQLAQALFERLAGAANGTLEKAGG